MKTVHRFGVLLDADAGRRTALPNPGGGAQALGAGRTLSRQSAMRAPLGTQPAEPSEVERRTRTAALRSV